MQLYAADQPCCGRFAGLLCLPIAAAALCLLVLTPLKFLGGVGLERVPLL